MITYFNKGTKEYILSECEKKEIEKLYKLGGRYFYSPDIEDSFVDIYDGNSEPILGNAVITLYGDTVKVLRELSMEFSKNLKSVFDIMQLYPNPRQIKLTQYEKDKYCYIYEKLGGRYVEVPLAGSQVIIYNDVNQPICTGFDYLYYTLFDMQSKAADEIMAKNGQLSIEKIINKFC